MDARRLGLVGNCAGGAYALNAAMPVGCVAGHIDSDKGPVVFYELRTLEPGDGIRVTRTDHRTAIFEVTRVHTFPKAHFPTKGTAARTGDRLGHAA